MTDTFQSLRTDLLLAYAARTDAFKAACRAGFNVQPHHRAASAKADARIEAVTKQLNAIGHFADQQRITSSGYSGAIVEHYDGDMYVIRLPGGRCVCDRHDIQLA